MKMQNEQGQQVYFNEVQKNGKVAYKAPHEVKARITPSVTRPTMVIVR